VKSLNSRLQYIQKSIELAKNSEVLEAPPWNPNSPERIAQIEQKLGRRLPKAFLEYCSSFGSHIHQIFGTEWPEHRLMREIGDDWEEDSQQYYAEFMALLGISFPEYLEVPLFEFANNAGYINFCMVLNGQDDPECLVYIEGESIESKGKFSEYLYSSLQQFEAYDPRDEPMFLKECPNIYRT